MALVRERVRPCRWFLEAEAVTKQNWLRWTGDFLALKVFVDVHRKLAELINIDRFRVLPFSLAA